MNLSSLGSSDSTEVVSFVGEEFEAALECNSGEENMEEDLQAVASKRSIESGAEEEEQFRDGEKEGLTSTIVKKEDLSAGDISVQYKYKNTTIDVKVDTESNIFTTLTISEIVPCTKTIVTTELPDYNSSKVLSFTIPKLIMTPCS
ncbi:hypothetical protein AAC387_Pa11g0453 [Persea americana]